MIWGKRDYSMVVTEGILDKDHPENPSWWQNKTLNEAMDMAFQALKIPALKAWIEEHVEGDVPPYSFPRI